MVPRKHEPTGSRQDDRCIITSRPCSLLLFGLSKLLLDLCVHYRSQNAVSGSITILRALSLRVGQPYGGKSLLTTIPPHLRVSIRQVVQARSALLSNFEVRSLLQELENEHIVRTKTAVRIKKEEEVNGVNSSIRPEGVEISENLRTIEVEVWNEMPHFSIYHLMLQLGDPVLVCRLSAYNTPNSRKHHGARERSLKI